MWTFYLAMGAVRWHLYAMPMEGDYERHILLQSHKSELELAVFGNNGS